MLPVPADSSRAEDIARLIETALNTFGRLDCLVVNAGGPPAGMFANLDDAAWHSAIELTLMSAVRAARLALPIMQAQKAGSITFIQSASIKSPIDNLLLSNSLRLGVAGMAKTLSREVAADGIRVNLLCPGATETGSHPVDGQKQRPTQRHDGGRGDQKNRLPSCRWAAWRNRKSLAACARSSLRRPPAL